MKLIYQSLGFVAVGLLSCALPSVASAADPVQMPGEQQEPAAGSTVAELPIYRVLSARHAVPTREALEAELPDAEEQLIAVATSEEASGWARQRAISLLSLYETAASMRALGALTHSEDADVRAMSLYTLARTFSDVGPQLLVLRLESVARSDGDERVVGYAIRSLRWIDASAADAALARLAADGPNPSLAATVRSRRADRAIAPTPTPLSE